MITIDYKDRRPLYQQIMDKIEELAIMGFLKADEQLPSVRILATELAINPNTIQRAYAELEKKGVTYSVPGKGSFLAKTQNSMVEDHTAEIKNQLESIVADAQKLGLSQIDLQKMIEEIWQNSSQSPKGGSVK